MSTKRITLLALGVALFVIANLTLQVPIYQNYYVSLGYIIMTVYLYSFGTIDGTIVGTIGVVLYCIITGGLRGMPGWTVGNIVIGLDVGIMFRLNRAMKDENAGRLTNPVLHIITCAGIALSVIVGIILVKSGIETMLYLQPFTLRIVTNTPAAIADIATMIVGFPVAVFVDKILQKQMPHMIVAK